MPHREAIGNTVLNCGDYLLQGALNITFNFNSSHYFRHIRLVDTGSLIEVLCQYLSYQEKVRILLVIMPLDVCGVLMSVFKLGGVFQVARPFFLLLSISLFSCRLSLDRGDYYELLQGLRASGCREVTSSD